MDLSTLEHSIRVCFVSLSPFNNNTELDMKGIWWEVCNAFIWIRIRTSGEILRAWYKPSWEQLLASKERQYVRFLTPNPQYILDHKCNDISREKLGVVDTIQNIKKYRSNGKPKWKECKITEWRREQYNKEFGEEDMLVDVKENGRVNIEISNRS
jgi:hypothetical protein